MPREKALQDDLQKTRQMMDIHTNVRRLYQKRNYVAAKDAVDNQLLVVTENPEALLLAAEVDACNGLVEVGLERCETVLKGDPNSCKAFLVKGYITFLTGLMDSGLSLMKEANRIDPDNMDVREMLKRGRSVHKDYMDGRSMAAGGRADSSKSQLKRAMDIFSGILEDESGFVPPKTPLYSLFLTERAESALYAQYYQAALSDAREAIEAKEDNLRAWIVKAHAFIALGRAREARDELRLARRTPWGQNNDQLKEVYSKADFEARVNEADQELRTMVAESRGGGRTMEDGNGQDVNRSNHRAGRRGSEISNEHGSSASGSNNSHNNSAGRQQQSQHERQLQQELHQQLQQQQQQRRRQSMTPAEERRRESLAINPERQNFLNEIRKQTSERLGDSIGDFGMDSSLNNSGFINNISSNSRGLPVNRQDVMREIRGIGSNSSDPRHHSPKPTATKNRDDVLKAIRGRKGEPYGSQQPNGEQQMNSRSARRDRQRRRYSESGGGGNNHNTGGGGGYGGNGEDGYYDEGEQMKHYEQQQQSQRNNGNGNQRRGRGVMSEADIRRRMSAI